MPETISIKSAREEAIHQIAATLETAWNAGDADAWSAYDAADIRYTVWNGQHIQGTAAVRASHRQIFTTMYKGSRIKVTVRWIRFLRPDIAAVQLDGVLTLDDREIKTRPLMVLTQQGERWQIEVFQNTPILPEPERPAGLAVDG